MRKYILIFLALFGCKKIDENGFQTYTIKKGKHRSGWRYNTTRSNSFNIEVIFDESAQYTTVDPVNQYDVNKLWGVSDCGNNHSDFEKITTVNINETNRMHLTISKNSYELRVNGVIKTVSRPCSGDYKRYKLYPYFGGDETAPHTIKIMIKE